MAADAAGNPLDDLLDVLVERVRAKLAAEPLPRRYLSKEALAAHLGVAPRTVKTWRMKGLPGHRVGREVMFSVEETDRWIERH